MRGDGLGGGSCYRVFVYRLSAAEVAASIPAYRDAASAAADGLRSLTARLAPADATSPSPAPIVTCAWCGDWTDLTFDADGTCDGCHECGDADPLGAAGERDCEECGGAGRREAHRGDGVYLRTVDCWTDGCRLGKVEPYHLNETLADLRAIGDAGDSLRLGPWIITRRWKGSSQPDTWEWAHEQYGGPGDGSPEECDPRCGIGRDLRDVLIGIECAVSSMGVRRG
jgi:hypothetical protein